MEKEETKKKKEKERKRKRGKQLIGLTLTGLLMEGVVQDRRASERRMVEYCGSPETKEQTQMKTGDEEAKVRLLRRVFVSYNDFKQAAHISSHILTAKLHHGYPEEDRHILQALNCAMIIAYARPFSGNRGSETMLPELPERFLNGFAPDERALHKVVIKDRNEVLAHSDSTAWRLRLSVIRSSGRTMLAPLHHDTTAPLDEKHTGMLNGMAHKLMDAVFAERVALEKELVDVLPTLSLEDGHVTGDERAMLYGGWTL